jgi:hypothetical protein
MLDPKMDAASGKGKMKKDSMSRLPDLVNLAGKATGGAEQLGDILGLKQNDKVAMKTDLVDFLLGRDGYEESKVELTTRRVALRQQAKVARDFALLARDLLKPTLGGQYSEVWDATGLVGSLRIPTSPDELHPLLQSLRSYLTARPALEVPQVNVTATNAGKIFTDLSAAQVAIGMQQSAVETARNARDEKATKLRRRIRGLENELEQLIAPLDPRWLAFGFSMPGADETPDAPENLRVTLIGNTAAALKWDAAPRAEYYRVWKRVVGVDEELVPVGSPADVDFTLEELPSNAEIEIAVSAVNNGGESALGEPQRVRTT